MSSYSHSAHPSAAKNGAPNWKWWIPAAGISRHVITSEIQRYLGADALVRPGQGQRENQGVDGFYISAYRNLTTPMIEDLKRETIKYKKEQEQQAAGARIQEQPHPSHHDPRRSGLGPTPPLPPHSTSAYPPPSTRSPYTPDGAYPPPAPRNGQQPAPNYPTQPYGGNVEQHYSDYHGGYQNPQHPYGGQQSNVSPNAPYSHPHYTTGGAQQPAGAYSGYPTPPVSQHPSNAYPSQVQVPRGGVPYQNPAAGYNQPQGQGYGYQAPTTSSNTYPGNYQSTGQYPYR